MKKCWIWSSSLQTQITFFIVICVFFSFFIPYFSTFLVFSWVFLFLLFENLFSTYVLICGLRNFSISNWWVGEAFSIATTLWCFWHHLSSILASGRGAWNPPIALTSAEGVFLPPYVGEWRDAICGRWQPYTPCEMLFALDLDTQEVLFKITMKANSKATCAPPFYVIPLMKLWWTLSSSRHLTKLISIFLRLWIYGCVLVLELVEDKRWFSSEENRLEKRLSLVMYMFEQYYYTLENFPYMSATESYKSALKVGRQGNAWIFLCFNIIFLYVVGLGFHEIKLALNVQFW